MQHRDAPKNSPNEVAATFPEGKKIVSRLIKQYEETLLEIKKYEDSVRSRVSRYEPTYMIDDVVAIAVCREYGDTKEWTEKNLKRLRRQEFAFGAPNKHIGNLTRDDIERAKLVPIASVLEIKMNKARCPFHEEKTASFHVYPDNHGYCFGCHKSADVIDIVRALHNTDFVGAVKKLLSL